MIRLPTFSMAVIILSNKVELGKQAYYSYLCNYFMLQKIYD